MAINVTNLDFVSLDEVLPMSGETVIAFVDEPWEHAICPYVMIRDGHDWINQETGECVDEVRVTSWADPERVYHLEVHRKSDNELLVYEFYNHIEEFYEDYNFVKKPSVCGNDAFVICAEEW